MPQTVCPRCQLQTNVSDQQPLCPQCGLNLAALLRQDLLFLPGPPPQLLCGQCRAPVKENDDFCTQCGKSFVAPAVTVSSAESHRPPMVAPVSGAPLNAPFLPTPPDEHPMVADQLGEAPPGPSEAPPQPSAPAAVEQPRSRRTGLNTVLPIVIGILAFLVYRVVQPLSVSPQLVDVHPEMWKHVLLSQFLLPMLVAVFAARLGDMLSLAHGILVGCLVGLVGSLLALIGKDYGIGDPMLPSGLVATFVGSCAGAGLGSIELLRDNRGLIAGIVMALYALWAVFLVAANCTVSGDALRNAPDGQRPRPAAGVEVAAYTVEGRRKLYTTKTAADGTWRFSGMKAGEYLIVCEDYREKKIARSALAGGTIPMHIVLETKPGGEPMTSPR